MKTMTFALLMMAMLAFVLVGCSDNSLPVTGTIGKSTSGAGMPSGLAKMEGVIHSATGGGHVMAFYNNPQMTYDGLITFSAIQRPNMEFSGSLQHHDFEMGFKFNAEVIDLKVVEVPGGMMAKLSCEIKHGKFPAGWNPGYSFLVIQDNGQGEGDFHTGIFEFPATGAFGIPIADWIAMGPQEMITTIASRIGYQQQWYPQHGNFTVR
jgi:hypothetical protein